MELGELDYPMFIVTAAARGERADVDKFERCAWTKGPEATPVLDEFSFQEARWIEPGHEA